VQRYIGTLTSTTVIKSLSVLHTNLQDLMTYLHTLNIFMHVATLMKSAADFLHARFYLKELCRNKQPFYKIWQENPQNSPSIYNINIFQHIKYYTELIMEKLNMSQLSQISGPKIKSFKNKCRQIIKILKHLHMVQMLPHCVH
jgi:hypothetical protein